MKQFYLLGMCMLAFFLSACDSVQAPLELEEATFEMRMHGHDDDRVQGVATFTQADAAPLMVLDGDSLFRASSLIQIMLQTDTEEGLRHTLSFSFNVGDKLEVRSYSYAVLAAARELDSGQMASPIFFPSYEHYPTSRERVQYLLDVGIVTLTHTFEGQVMGTFELRAPGAMHTTTDLERNRNHEYKQFDAPLVLTGTFNARRDGAH